jgi:hypothetical protein
MWLCLNDAFLSIVSKDCARDEVLVRARRKGDIEKVWPYATVKRDEFADYLFRAVITREAVGTALLGELERVTYANFKDSVKDDMLHGAYLRVWSAMRSLQPLRGVDRGRMFDIADDMFVHAVKTKPPRRKRK